MILIVEDELITRMVAADVIAELGLPALEARNADEALEILRTHPNVAVLFTDIDMPGTLDGMELARKVHEQWPAIELIVTSGASNLANADLPVARLCASPTDGINWLKSSRKNLAL